MVKLKLVPYILKIRNLDKSKRNKPVYENLTKINFAKHFQDFIKANNSIKVDSSNEKIFNCDSCSFDSSNLIYYGTLGYGDYGYSSEIISTKTKKVISTKQVDEAEKIKFYYLIKIMKNEAYVLLNQFKHRGIKTQFGKEIKKYIDSKKVIANNFIISLNPLVSSELANIEKLQKLTFIRKRKSQDIESQILTKIDDKEENETITEEKVIKLKGNKTTRFKQLIKGINKNYKENNYVEIDNQKYPTIKINVKMNDGSSKVIKLNADIKFNEGIEQEFDGDFPKIKDYYDSVKPYFLRIIGEQ